MSGNLCSRGNLIVAALIPYVYFVSYCKSFFIRDVHGEFGLKMCINSTYCLQFCVEKLGFFLSGEWSP